jgi:lysozyme
VLPGIDVSHYQEMIDWKKVKASGVKFAIIKASEGIEYVDPLFEDNFRGCIDNGIVPGVSHFYLPRYDPVDQAKHYWNTIRDVAKGHNYLPPANDLETAGITKSQMNDDMSKFMQATKEYDGRPGIFGTSPGFFTTYLPVPVLSQYRLSISQVDWISEYPLWIFHYTTGWPTQIYPWAGWTFWQYSSAGKVSGIRTRVDLDYFNGSEIDLREMAATIRISG